MTDPELKKKARPSLSFVGTLHEKTSYWESLMHLFKGNIGVGLFAMGDAFKNGGIYVSVGLSIFLAIVCIHCQRVLLNCTDIVRGQVYEADRQIDYAEALELSFANGSPRVARLGYRMGQVCTAFIIVTQLGFCCIYLTFIAENIHKVLQYNEIDINLQLVIMMIWVPIYLCCLITQLKSLAPVSIISNILLLGSFFITMYFALHDGLPSLSERKPYTTPYKLMLFFGTVIFSYEGIALVLPIRNSMQNPKDFSRPLGVLNVGMFMVVTLYMFSGICGYMKWGEDVHGTMTTNTGDSGLAQCTQIAVAVGILLTYPLQFFVPINVLIIDVIRKFKCRRTPFLCELIFRTLLSMLTLLVAQAFPNVGIFISLVGALCSTVLALVFPPVMECLLLPVMEISTWLKALKIVKNIVILIIACLSFFAGTCVSVSEIVIYFDQRFNNSTKS